MREHGPDTTTATMPGVSVDQAAIAHLTFPAAAVQRARKMLEIERNLEKVSDSLFDTIVANELESATALATRMLGDYRQSAQVVHEAFEKARTEFAAYDGSDNPRSWILGYVAEEAMRSSAMDSAEANHVRCQDAAQPDTETALRCLRPDSRLAVILTDVLGMTDDVAARVARVDMRTVRRRASAARSWIARHLAVSSGSSSLADSSGA